MPNTLNYGEQGGARTVIGGSIDVISGGEIDIESGGSFKLSGVDVIRSISFSPAQGGANVCEVTISLLNAAGSAITGQNYNLEIWLSDAATGLGLTSTTASGTVQAKSTEGTDLTVLTAKKHLISQTKDSVGTYILEITDSAKTGFYIACKNPVTGEVEVSSQLVTGNYGS